MNLQKKRIDVNVHSDRPLGLSGCCVRRIYSNSFTAVGIIGLKGVNTNRGYQNSLLDKDRNLHLQFIMSMIRRGPEDVLVFLRDGKK